MDEYYDFFSYQPPQKKLNIKKVAIIVGVIVILIIILILILSIKKNEPPVEDEFIVETTESSFIFYDANQSISIEIPNTHSFKQYNSESTYLIELRSENNTNIFISKKAKLEGKNLNSVVTADKTAFTESFSSLSNLSDIKDLIVNDRPAYTYSFHYLDTNLNKAFYIQIVWLEVDNNYYVFDVEFPLDDIFSNTNLLTDVLINFKEITK